MAVAKLSEKRNPKFNIKGLNHVAVVCSDMKRTVDFYQGVLGFPLVKTVALGGGDGQHFFFDMGDGHACLAFFYFPTAPDAVPGITHPRVNLGAFVPGQADDYVTAVGSMHHIAFNVDPDTLLDYKRRLEDAGIIVSKVLGHYDEDRRKEDRQSGDPEDGWLRSIYFRDPDGIALEFACWDRSLHDNDVVHEPASGDKPSLELHKKP